MTEQLDSRQRDYQIFRGASEETAYLGEQPPRQLPKPVSYLEYFFNPIVQVWDWKTAQRNGRIVDDE